MKLDGDITSFMRELLLIKQTFRLHSHGEGHDASHDDKPFVVSPVRIGQQENFKFARGLAAAASGCSTAPARPGPFTSTHQLPRVAEMALRL